MSVTKAKPLYLRLRQSPLFRIVRWLCLLGISALFLTTLACKDDSTKKRRLSQKYFQELAGRLQKELKAAMQAGGPVAAISVCNVQGPAIEKALSNPRLQIRRVSLKPRNPGHIPDATEKAVLQEWEKLLSQGKTLPLMTEHKGEAGLYIMQPIRIQKQLCLKCHGDPALMSPELKERLRTLYPKDQATGYKIEDLRGAFVAIWKESDN